MNRRFTALIAPLVLAASVCVVGVGSGLAAAAPAVGAWTPSSNGLSLVRYSFRATTLLDGRVLVEGGFAPGTYTPEAEIYDPATNAWSVVSPMNDGRGEQTATLLADGRVLVAGGYAGPVLSTAEIFDPSTGQWTRTGSMNVNRTRHAAVRLCDGRVLAVGGWNGQEISSAEIYDPSAGLWSLTPGSLPAPVSDLEGFLLPNCTALFVGGNAGNPNPAPSAAAYLFHPDTGTFTATASMHYARAGFSGAQLPDGRVLVMGGNTASSSTTAEIFDPATQQWSDVAPMTDPHTLGQGEEAQTLPDGRVLVPGDTANGLAAELYDPAANTWSFTGPQNAVHYGGVTALLHDGRVLNAGGFDSARTYTTVGETYAAGIPGEHRLNVPFATEMGSAGNPNSGSDNCGPASITMAVLFYGGSTTVPDAAIAIRGSNNSHNGPTDFKSARTLAFLRQFSLVENNVATWDQLRAEIAAGRPVVILVNNHAYRHLKPPPYPNNNRGWFTRAHIIVVTGYDPANVYVNDPLRVNAPDYAIPVATFQKAASTARGSSPTNWYAASVLQG